MRNIFVGFADNDEPERQKKQQDRSDSPGKRSKAQG
jgi:hypothetical protein